jgi:hypothetical protein
LTRHIEHFPPKKNSAAGTPVSHNQTDLKLQSRRNKLRLTTKPASAIRMGIGFVELMPQSFWAAAEAGIQFTNFDSTALKKQFLISLSF